MNMSSLHNYIALVPWIRAAVTITKEPVDVHFKAPCLSPGPGGQSLNVHFKPDAAVIVDHSYEEQCLQCNEMTIFNALHLRLKGGNCTVHCSVCWALSHGVELLLAKRKGGLDLTDTCGVQSSVQ